MPLHQFQVVGRRQPTKLDPVPQIYRMRLFAKNQVMAKSRFWYFLHQMDKMKKATGEILAVNEIREKNNRIVKNYGITIKYNSRSGTHNMYKVFRATTVCKAVEQMYNDMAGRHRARRSSIQIRDARVVKAGVRASRRAETGQEVECVKSVNLEQFLTSKVRFPLPQRLQRASNRRYTTTFKYKMPSTFFN
eukprot:TRINITY_DN2228_c1_g1_i1.p1 TRINITY_DN2228_c1_g1~~TRINITY_DN2228_c1_g1_i1.p1  ORF type:complete len:201 (-),score=38.37 TRINITY_DN2228_c1_g1_i1:281-853(-)